MAKIKLSTLTMIAILSMVVPIAQAEHSKIESLEIDDSLNEILQIYIQSLDTFAGITGIIWNGKTDTEIIAAARNTVTEDFKDPESAKFRDERVFRITNPDNEKSIYVCGEVNGKNSYDAYAGYRGYWAGAIAHLEDPNNKAFSYLYLHYCTR